MYWEKRKEMGLSSSSPQERCPWLDDPGGGGGRGVGKAEHPTAAGP